MNLLPMRGHVNIRVHGEVQDVGFRYETVGQARALGLTGFARNERGGTVYIEAEGEEEKLRQFVEWCRKGPSYAKVEKVEVKHGEQMKNFSEFVVEY